MRKVLRRIPAIRFCILQYHKRERQRQAEAQWAYVQSVLTTIGNMTITWAGIGLIFNHFIEWYHPKGGRVLRKDRQIPRMFSEKLKYLKGVESDVRWTIEERATLALIRSELDELNEFRTNLIHGLVHQKDRRSTVWHVHIAKEQEQGLLRRNVVYSNEDIQREVARMSALSNLMSQFFAQIVGIPHPANPPPAPPTRAPSLQTYTIGGSRTRSPQ